MKLSRPKCSRLLMTVIEWHNTMALNLLGSVRQEARCKPCFDSRNTPEVRLHAGNIKNGRLLCWAADASRHLEPARAATVRRRMKQKRTKASTEAMSRKSSDSSWSLDLGSRLSTSVRKHNLSVRKKKKKTTGICEQSSKPPD